MDKIIEYYRKENYGNKHLYIKDANLAHSISLLTGKKTLLPEHILALQQMGYTMVEVPKANLQIIKGGPKFYEN